MYWQKCLEQCLCNRGGKMIIRLPIDTKSLYFNIKNDNQSGHTATVATPMKQGKSIHEELARILEVPENISEFNKEDLSTHILSKSRAEAKIVKTFVFERVTINGIKVDCDYSFCIYIREETGVDNVHFGRQKVHYPPTLKFSNDDLEINNKKVVEKISEILKDYAFIVEAFEYNTETRVLNFDAVIVGQNGIPYSKVFQNKKGVGNKFSAVFNEFADVYDSEIIALREHLGYDNVSTENFVEVMENNHKIALGVVEANLRAQGIQSIRFLSEEYPYALYDIEYEKNGLKNYILCRFTSTKLKYFNLPHFKIKFCNDFSESVALALVTNINESPKLNWFRVAELNSMNKAINSITYTVRGE